MTIETLFNCMHQAAMDSPRARTSAVCAVINDCLQLTTLTHCHFGAKAHWAVHVAEETWYWRKQCSTSRYACSPDERKFAKACHPVILMHWPKRFCMLRPSFSSRATNLSSGISIELVLDQTPATLNHHMHDHLCQSCTMRCCAHTLLRATRGIYCATLSRLTWSFRSGIQKQFQTLRYMQFQVDIKDVQWHNVPGHQRVEAPKRCYVGKGCSCLLLARWELLIHGHTSTLPYIYNCMNVNSCPRSATIMAKGRTVTSSDSCDGSGCIPPTGKVRA